MAPKAASDNTGRQKTYSADVVAAVLCSTGTTSLTNKNYEMMSALDGKKTATAFQHDFRSVIAKAKDLKARLDGGEVFEPVAPTSSRAKTKKQGDTPTTTRKRKGGASSDSDETPSKKKATPKKKGTPKPAKISPPAFDDEALPFDAEEFIKAEQKWEEEFGFN